MEDIRFWKSWPKAYQYILLSVALILVSTMVFMLTGLNRGEGGPGEWFIYSSANNLSINTETFTRGQYDISIKAENYLLTQYYSVDIHTVSILKAYIFMMLTGISAAIILAAISMARKMIWYLVSMTAIISWLGFSKLEQLQYWGNQSKLLLIIFLVSTIGISFYFHAYRGKTSFLGRFITFLIVMILIQGSILIGSKVSSPVLYLMHNSYMVPTIIALFFIMFVAHEIPSRFLVLLTQNSSANPSWTLANYAFFCLLYLGNIALMSLNELGYVAWELSFFSPWWLLIASTIIGVWGLIEKEQLYTKAFAFAPTAVFLYLGIGIWSFATIAYSLHTANSPMIEVFRQGILYTHLVFGSFFLLYIFVNFRRLILMNKAVHKVMYKPHLFPYHLIWLCSIVCIGSITIKKFYAPYYNWKAGQINMVGDIYMHEKKWLIANEFYNETREVGMGNHRSDMSLAFIALENDNYSLALKEYKTAISRNPSEKSIIAYANMQREFLNPIEELWTLQEGVKKFPRSTAINNNLGLAFLKMNIIDSAYLYLNKAADLVDGDPVPQTNLLALSGLQMVNTGIDPRKKYKDHEDYLPFRSNIIAISNLIGEKTVTEFNKKEIPTDSISTEHLIYLHNLFFNQKKNTDTTIISCVQAARKSLKNESSFESLDFILGCHAVWNGKPAEARERFNHILESCDVGLYPYYSNFAGLAMFKNYHDDIAMQYFDKSSRSQLSILMNDAPIHLAMVQGLNGYSNDALKTLSSYYDLTSSNHIIIKELIPVLNYQGIPKDSSDRFKELFALFNSSNISNDEANTLLQSFKDIDSKVQAACGIMTIANKSRQFEKSNLCWEMIKEDYKKSSISQEIDFQHLLLLTGQGRFNELIARIDQVKLSDNRKNYLSFLKALAYENTGSNLAESSYKTALQKNPLASEVVIKAALYFDLKSKKPKESFEILSSGIKTFPNSVEMLQTYVYICLKLGYMEFADSAVEDLKTLLPPNESTSYSDTYQKLRADAVIKLSEWN